MYREPLIKYTINKINLLSSLSEITDIDKIYNELGNKLILPQFNHYGDNLGKVSDLRYELMKMSMEYRDLSELVKKGKYLKEFLIVEYENKYKEFYVKKVDEYKLSLMELLKYIQEEEYIEIEKDIRRP